MRGTPGSAYPQPEPNATELPSSAPGRPELIELQASAPSPTPTRAEEHIATTPDCRPRAPAPSPTPTRAGHLSGLQIVRLRALARRRAPKRTPHYTSWCERGTLHVKRLECFNMGARNRDAAVAASWQQHHRSLFAPRRSAGTAAAARSCGVAAATATMCAEHSHNDVRCQLCSAQSVQRCAFPFALRALVHCPIRAQRRAFPFAKPV